MSTKQRLLELLEKNKGNYLSGEELAGQLKISRTAIWKAVKSLKQSGYNIDSVTNKGYCLSATSDMLSQEGINSSLNIPGLEIEVFQSIDSTNTYVRQKADAGASEGFCAVAAEQTLGRGRRGRSFYSPEGTGVYLSLLLRPSDYDGNRAANITTMAAVAVCEAIEEVTGVSPAIKWVNDVFLDNKKICGILTEASFDLESSMCEYAVLGIGVNVYYPEGGFPEEISSIAGAILDKEESDTKNRLAAAIITHFMQYYKDSGADGEKSDYQANYKKRCFVLGKQIEVISGGVSKEARAIDLDDNCHLLVEYADGSRELLSYGEISIKPITEG